MKLFSRVFYALENNNLDFEPISRVGTVYL